MAFFDIAVLKIVRYGGKSYAHALCPMPYALCPREHLMLLRKAIPRAITRMIEEVRKPGFGIRVTQKVANCRFKIDV